MPNHFPTRSRFRRDSYRAGQGFIPLPLRRGRVGLTFETMNNYWITFTDGTEGCCQGATAYDSKTIAEKLTGKTVRGNKYSAEGAVVIPYPASPVIWQLDHPVSGKFPPFCYSPRKCAGKTDCPHSRACSE